MPQLASSGQGDPLAGTHGFSSVWQDLKDVAKEVLLIVETRSLGQTNTASLPWDECAAACWGVTAVHVPTPPPTGPGACRKAEKTGTVSGGRDLPGVGMQSFPGSCCCHVSSGQHA